MSLKPIEPRHYASNDVDLGAGGHISNQARSMNHYGSQHKRPEGMGTSPSATGGMRAYTPHGTPKKDKRKTVVAIVILIVVLIAVAVGIGVGVTSCNSEVENTNQSQQRVTLTIPSGYGAGDIAQLLYDNHVIASTTTFMQTAQQHSATGSLKAGTYTFESGSSYEDIVNALVAGPEVSGVTLTIPEGFTVLQVAQRVSATFPSISYDEFMAQAKASNYVGEFTFLNGAYNDSLEGFLFPKTYTFEQSPTADAIIRTMLRQFSIETSALDWAAATYGNVSLTQYQAICMASLVERETAQDSERALVASVMYNRLNAGMYLQIDASIAYALNKSDLLTWDDLQVDSEYNLYTHYGLTPGPICSPSLESIKAVLNTEQTGYYYYVASEALDGTHVFCETYEQFEVALQAYNLAAGISG